MISRDGARYVFNDLPELDRAKTAFLRELGRMRTTFGNAYLSYGRIVRPVEFDAGTIEMSFRQELPGIKEVINEGSWTVPRVMHGAWVDDAERGLGLAFVNIGRDAISVAIESDLGSRWGIDGRGRSVRMRTHDGDEVVGEIDQDNRLTARLDLPPRLPVLVEVAG